MALGVTVDLVKFRLYSRLLENFARKSVPFAAKSALNEIAFDARKEWATKQIPEAFTLRNTWTARGVRVDKAQGRTIAGMQSKVGSIREYMLEREEGDTQTKRGKHGVAVPTTGASGQPKKAKRTKAVRPQNYLNAIQVARSVSGTRKRRNVVGVMMALKTGGVAYLEMRKSLKGDLQGGLRKGLFRVTGGKRRPKLRLLYDLTKSTVTTKPIPTLERTVDAVRPRFLKAHVKAMHAELVRHKMAW